MIIALLIDACIGLAFALAARDRVRADGPFAFPAFPLVAAFSAIVVAPIALYLYAAHPAWSWMYLFDPAELPGLFVLPVLAGQAGAVLGAFYLGARLIRGGKQRALRYAVGAAPVVVLAAVVILWRRLGHYGSHAEFHEGRALDLMDVKLGYVLVGAVLGLAAAAGFVAVELMRDARRVRSR